MSTVVEQIKAKLTTEIGATHVDVIDNSWMHAGHAGAASGGSHVKVYVVSPQFEGKNLLEQHRLVHQALKVEMEHAIHALELKTFTPTSWQETLAKKEALSNQG